VGDAGSPGDELVADLLDAVRSLGMERGIDLLLVLLYGRWSVAADNPPLWQDLCSPELDSGARLALLRPFVVSEVVPGPLLDRVASADSGGVVGLVFELLDSVSQGQVGDLFERVLAERSRLLSRAAVESDTPPELAQLMLAAARPDLRDVLDPACGTGTCLLAAHRAGAKRLYGIELNGWTATIARMRLTIAGAEVRVVEGNAMMRRWVRMADTVLLDPPWGTRLDSGHRAVLSELAGHETPSPSGDLLWAQVAREALRPFGRAVVLLPQGVGWRPDEQAHRRALVADGGLEGHVSLTAPKRHATAVDGAFWILRAPDEGGSNRGTLVADLSPARIEAAGATGTPSALLRGALQDLRSTGSVATLPPSLGIVVSPEVVVGETYLATLLEAVPTPSVVRPSIGRRLLTELRIEGMKAFGQWQRVELAPITLLYGQNSAGKSSVLQSLLLLAQSHRASSLMLQGESTDAGSFAGLLHRHDRERTLGLGASFGATASWLDKDAVPNPSHERSVDFRFGADVAGAAEQLLLRIGLGRWAIDLPRVPGRKGAPDRFEADTHDVSAALEALHADRLMWRANESRPWERENAEDLRRERLAARRAVGRVIAETFDDTLPLATDGLLPGSIEEDALRHLDRSSHGIGRHASGSARSALGSLVELLDGISGDLRRLLDEMVYLGPLRSAPRRFYDRAAAAGSAGTIADNVALHLFDNSSDLAMVNEWLERLQVPYELDVVPVHAGSRTALGDVVALVLRDRRIDGVEIGPLDVGFGVSQVLPIVAELTARQQRVVLIEQPEIHLHPKLQTELGDLLIETTLDTGNANQVIVETHSEHLLLRLQRRIREGAIPAEHVAVDYVDTLPDGKGATVQRLRLDERGAFLDQWPQGFFEESLDEILGGFD
jgi:predicted ATPase